MPTFNLKYLRNDKEATQDGVWVDMGGGAEFKLASTHSAKFTKAFQTAMKPYTKTHRQVPEAEQERIMNRCVANHILLDWKGVFDGEDKNGEGIPLPYSMENALTLLTEMDWVRESILKEAADLENYKQHSEAETIKN